MHLIIKSKEVIRKPEETVERKENNTKKTFLPSSARGIASLDSDDRIAKLFRSGLDSEKFVIFSPSTNPSHEKPRTFSFFLHADLRGVCFSSSMRSKPEFLLVERSIIMSPDTYGGLVTHEYIF